MNFLTEWVLAWHRAVWFPVLYFSKLEAEPVETDFFNLEGRKERSFDGTSLVGGACAGSDGATRPNGLDAEICG